MDQEGAIKVERALKRVIGILLPPYSGLNAGLIVACGKEKQSITPGLRAGGLTSIAGAAAKHHSPIICDSLRNEETLGVPSASPPPCHCKHKLGFTFTQGSYRFFTSKLHISRFF
ncbi:hypothetical protein XENOCAPTIV_011738 [Xenoophorus captivus]|uniref:Uncharacterized protein n=1 Tax=Xenoophorus captivus TaxID=1517983 RepID=A0ABV0R2H6_9TELE